VKTDLHHYDRNLNGHMKKLKGSIHIISSRVKCIKHCLESLWNNYNSNHNYPVYVYYFDDIYDSLDLQKDIIGDTGQNVVFVTVPYKTPDFISESELYYNRKDIQYVNTSFSINRKGYLHMCNFTSNIYGYQNTELDNYDFKFIYLLGADNINFAKKDKFVVYQGSHGDKGAEIADIILPGAAYTEKNGLFINLEGKLQNAYKASYPPGDAHEDWIIFKDLANMIKKPLEYNNVNQLRESINKQIQLKINNDFSKTNIIDFVEEKISVKPIDYYYTNPIARSSKVMSECRQISKKLLFTGIEKAS